MNGWIRRGVVLGLVCASMSLTAVAGYPLPGKVFTADEFEKAVEKAVESGKPLALLQGDTSTSCPLSEHCAVAMMNEFDSKAIIVHFNSQQDWNKLPENFRKPFSRNEAVKNFGQYIPRIAFYDPNSGEMFSKLGYTAYQTGGERAFRDVSKEIREFKASIKPASVSKLPERKVQSETAASADAPEELAASTGLRLWTNSAGKQVNALFVSHLNGMVRLRLQNGSEHEIALDQLSAADQEYVKSSGPTLAAQ